MKIRLIGFALLAVIFLLNCQNTTETVEEKKSDELAANSMTFKLDGNTVTISALPYAATATTTTIGFPVQGQYIAISTGAALNSGVFNNASNPNYYLFYAAGGTAYSSDNTTAANITFTVTAGATEITGTFSGNIEKLANGQISTITEGRFRVNKP